MEDTQFNLIIGAYTIDRILARLSKPDMMVCQKKPATISIGD